MIRLNMVVEGQTEEAFVHAVLEGPLAMRSVFVAVRCVETSRDKRRHKVYRGGLLDYQRAKGDLLRWLSEDRRGDARFTTMFDLYRLPEDFPGREQARRLKTPWERVEALESSFRQDINDPRFLPYIQLHEFEALLFVEPSKFDWEFIEHAGAIARLASISAKFASPEEINDTESPSKRIIKEIPEYEYQKSSAGPVIASKIGLPSLRQKCPHFHRWLGLLEALS